MKFRIKKHKLLINLFPSKGEGRVCNGKIYFSIIRREYNRGKLEKNLKKKKQKIIINLKKITIAKATIIIMKRRKYFTIYETLRYESYDY